MQGDDKIQSNYNQSAEEKYLSKNNIIIVLEWKLDIHHMTAIENITDNAHIPGNAQINDSKNNSPPFPVNDTKMTAKDKMSASDHNSPPNLLPMIQNPLPRSRCLTVIRRGPH